MATYLLTWNPDRKHRWDDLQALLKNRETDWSCGNRRLIPLRSRVFLLKQGPEPRGVVASGFTVSDVYSKRHWDPARAHAGAIQNCVDVKFETVLGPDPTDLLPLSRLEKGALNSVKWGTRVSGIEISEDVAPLLEREWGRFASGHIERGVRSARQALENTMTEERRYVRKRDRSLRQQAFVEAGGVCAACGTNFGDFLDGLGMKVLQVHHVRQLSASNAPRITSVRDLSVVCANCHLLIHADPRSAMPLEKLRRLLGRVRSNHHMHRNGNGTLRLPVAVG